MQVRSRLFRSTTSPGTPPAATYTALHDLDGNGQIASTDILLVRRANGSTLPAGEPTVPAATTMTSTGTTTSTTSLFSTRRLSLWDRLQAREGSVV